jgi:hypothetical protein
MTTVNIYSLIDELESRYSRILEYEGRNAIYRLKGEEALDFDSVRESAGDAIEEVLFDSDEWELVKAAMISDIACEFGNRLAEEHFLDIA